MQGRLIYLMGPSGSGKTTILRILMTLESLSGGRIEIDGLDLATTPTERLARAMAVMGQQTHIASRLRVAELVGFGRWPHHRGRPRERQHRLPPRPCHRTAPRCSCHVPLPSCREVPQSL